MHILIEPLFVLVFVSFVFSGFAFADSIKFPERIERRIGYGLATALCFVCLLAMILHL